MKITYAKEGNKVTMPVPGKSFSTKSVIDEDSLIIELTSTEKLAGILKIPVIKIIEKIEKNV